MVGGACGLRTATCGRSYRGVTSKQRSKERSAEEGVLKPGTINRDNPDNKPCLSRV
jgi:hypothetical protein